MFDKKKKSSDKEDMKKDDMNPFEKKAKIGVLQHLSDSMGEAMKDRLGGLKKVTVAADSEEGLKHGMDKAKDLVEGKLMPHEEDSSEEEMEPSQESSEEEAKEEEMSAEEIQQKIAELQELLKHKKD